MKKYKLLLMILVSLNMYGQVGIGTIVPSAMLDINGDLRIRNVPSTPVETKYLVIDADGNVGWSTVNGGSALITSAQLNQEWRGAYTDIISGTTGYYENTSIDLQMDMDLVVPDGQFHIMILEWAVPVGIKYPVGVSVDATIGVRLYIDNVLMDRETVSVTVKTDGHVFLRGSHDIYINANTGVDIVKNYRLEGFVIQKSSSVPNTFYRFIYYDSATGFDYGREKMKFHALKRT